MFTYSAFSQTKEETIDWLKYHLHKYYGGNYDNTKRLQTIKNKLPYSWSSHQYIFDTDKLTIITFRYEVDSTGHQEVLSEISETIKLKRVIKVESSVYKEDNSSWGNANIKLIFKDPESDAEGNIKEHGVSVYDEKNKKDLTIKKGYTMGYNLTSYDEETVNSKTEKSFTKAFSRLVELCGGKLIKDIF